ncbi:MAG: hypothetical protein IJG45_05420 [Oscillospiraceae bacterium]|nr:hypothetical protein [Oscillospiraceae bacterium]
MAEIFIPTLHTFVNENVFTGSCGQLRFRVAPQVVMATKKEADLSASTILCELWYGEKCYELSEIAGQRSFPMSEEGRAEMKAWLESRA